MTEAVGRKRTAENVTRVNARSQAPCSRTTPAINCELGTRTRSPSAVSSTVPVASIAAIVPRMSADRDLLSDAVGALDVAPGADLPRHLAPADPEGERERCGGRREQDGDEHEQDLGRHAELRERGDDEHGEHDRLREPAERAGMSICVASRSTWRRTNSEITMPASSSRNASSTRGR